MTSPWCARSKADVFCPVGRSSVEKEGGCRREETATAPKGA